MCFFVAPKEILASIRRPKFTLFGLAKPLVGARYSIARRSHVRDEMHRVVYIAVGGEGNGIASAGRQIRKWREEVSHYPVITCNNVDLMRGFKYRL